MLNQLSCMPHIMQANSVWHVGYTQTLKIYRQVDFAEMWKQKTETETRKEKIVLATVLRQELQLYFILFILGLVVTCWAERRLNFVPALRT